MTARFAPFELDAPSGPAQGTLVCLAGLNSGAYLFTGARAALPGWQVIRFTTPGVNGVPMPMPFSVAAYARHVLGHLRTLAPLPRPLVILGHSMGGYAAQELARLLLHDPVLRPDRLVLVSTSRGQPETTQDVAAMEAHLGQGFLEYLKQLERNPAEGLKPLFGPGWTERMPLPYMNFLAQRAACQPPAAALFGQLAAGAAFSSRRWVGQLVIPALVIHGRADILVRPESGEALAAALPQARFLELYDVGHFPMLERESFWALVADFLHGAELGQQVMPPPSFWQRVHDWWQRSG